MTDGKDVLVLSAATLCSATSPTTMCIGGGQGIAAIFERL